jgi:hypothetical protein
MSTIVPQVTIDTRAITVFENMLASVTRTCPELSGPIRDLIYSARPYAVVGTAGKKDQWPDIILVVAPTFELIASIRRILGPSRVGQFAEFLEFDIWKRRTDAGADQ